MYMYLQFLMSGVLYVDSLISVGHIHTTLIMTLNYVYNKVQHLEVLASKPYTKA
jgi:hypothetical protein